MHKYLPALLALTSSLSLADPATDLKALLSGGPRVAGSAATRQAADYLAGRYRALGYQVRLEPFSYVRTRDTGSSVGVDTAYALSGSAGRRLSAPLAVVDGAGTPEDYARAGVSGKVALVSRGTLRFAEKARNAQAAGALALVIVNTAAGELRGTLGQDLDLPVLGVNPATGAKLRALAGQGVDLKAGVVRETVAGQNVVAFPAGSARPQLVFGGHYDSVTGAPGANDNASGSAAVLEIAGRLAKDPLGKNAWFVAFDGEEDGLRGSRAFVEAHPAELRGLGAMLNFDMVGVPVTPLSVGGTPALAERARRAVPGLGALSDASGSDHASFLDAGLPALFFHSGLDVNYHQSGDTQADPALIRAAADAGLKVARAVVAELVP